MTAAGLALRRHAVWAALMAAGVMVVACSTVTSRPGADIGARKADGAMGVAALQGSFVQFDAAVHGTWTRTDWLALFKSFRALGLRQIVVQWSVFGDSAFYASRSFRAPPMPALETVLDLADEAGMRVLVGLVHEPDYWERLRSEPAELSRQLAAWRERSLQAAGELAPLVAAHPSFEGWYLSEEVDDINWRDAARRELLFNHLGSITGSLRRLTPRSRIAVSGFANAGTDTVAFGAFWRALLGDAPELDTVLFQDGVGAAKLSLQELPAFLAAVKQATDRHRRELRVIVEVFHQTGGEPLDGGPFRAEPATLERIARQMEIARDYASSLVAFSVPDYMFERASPQAARLFDAYRRACARC